MACQVRKYYITLISHICIISSFHNDFSGIGLWRYIFDWKNKSSDVRKSMCATDLATGITYLPGW